MMYRSLFVLLAASPALAQSLYLQSPAPQLPAKLGQLPDAGTSLYGVSMFAVQPPPPRSYKLHDLVTIVVDESSKQEAEQKTKSDKTGQLDLQLGALLDIRALMEAQLKQGDTTDLDVIKAKLDNNYDGKGKYERTDRFTMKIQAEVIDVKPNGVLVIEARKNIDKNGETQSIVLSGRCRSEDVTKSNTVFSSQLADLTLTSIQTGEVDKSGSKGILTKALETVFAF